MNKYKKLINNSFIFTIGSLGTKVITFILIPLYTFFLLPKELGIIDIFIVSLNFVVPLFTLSIFDAVFRFTMDREYDSKKIIVNAFIVNFFGVAILLLLSPLFYYYFNVGTLFFTMTSIVLLQFFYASLSQYIRALGKVKLYVLASLINSVSLLFLNIFFLWYMKLGINGYFISYLLSLLIAFLLLLKFENPFKHFQLSIIDVKLIRIMLMYSIPLIPNALMWWIITLSDRYLINIFLGLAANGIYAVASKIPGVITIINSIFFQAWQISAIEESENRKVSTFQSNIFNTFSFVTLSSTSLIIVNLKLIISNFVGEDYYISWMIVPFLLLSVVFSGFSSFLGTNYIVTKNTKGILLTTIYGAVGNILLNLVLIPPLGLKGAALSTLFSFVLVFIIRLKEVKKTTMLKVDWLNFYLTLTLIFIQIGVLFLGFDQEYLLNLSLFFIITVINLKYLNKIKTLSKKFKKN